MWLILLVVLLVPCAILLLGMAKAAGRYDRAAEEQFAKGRYPINEKVQPDQI